MRFLEMLQQELDKVGIEFSWGVILALVVLFFLGVLLIVGMGTMAGLWHSPFDDEANEWERLDRERRKGEKQEAGSRK